MPVQVGIGYIDIVPDMSGFARDLKRGMSRDLAAAGDAAGSTLGKKMSEGLSGALKGAAAGIGFAAAGNFLKGAIGAASDLNEVVSMSETIFGASGKAMEQWAAGGAEDFGLSKRAALEAAAGFGNMFSQLGLGTSEAARLSQGIVELGTDFASFFRGQVSQEEVLNAQAAAFRGEYDSLQRFLPLINAAAVEQKALALTGKAATKELTAQDKALAVNALMFEGAGAALGDFDRTAGSLAGQQQILTAEWENAKATLGEGLMPVMTNFVNLLNDTAIPALKGLFSTDADAAGWATAIQDFVGDTVGFITGSMQEVLRLWANLADKIPFHWGEGMAADLREAADAGDGFRDKMHATTEELRSWTVGTANQTAAQKLLTSGLKGAVGPLDLHTMAVKDADKAGRDAAAAQRTLQRAQRDYNELIAKGRVDEEAVADARERLDDATRSAAGADRDLAKAQKEHNEALTRAQSLGLDSAWDDLADATDNLADAQDRASDAHQDAADAEKELRDAQAGDPDYQNKLADARDRVAEATDKIAVSATKVAETGAALQGWSTNLGGALDSLGLKADGLLPKLTALSAFDTGNILAGQVAPATEVRGLLGGAGLRELVGAGTATAGATTVNNKTVNITVTQTDPDPKKLAREMSWALD